jgi:quinol monooxygenase YgiN
MIVVRFRVQVRPEQAGEVKAALAAAMKASRAVEGVVSFDIGRDVSDPCTFFAFEVFEDRDALARQESLPEVRTVLDLLPGAVTAPPEATVYEVSSAESHGG